MSIQSRCATLYLVMVFLAAVASAGDWSNAGGNAGRFGRSYEIGPQAANLLWSGGATSLIAWQPVSEGDRVFMVRQSGWPSAEPKKSPVIAYDVNTGEELWVQHIPFFAGDWTTWVAGVMDGQVYAGRSGNGASVWAKLYALDAATGAILWESEDEISAGAYDGVVFAPNGDPIIGSFQDIWRIDAVDGSTVWHADRVGSVSGTCGAALHGDAIYVADAAPGGHVIARHDLATGEWMYDSPVMPGFTLQNTPMVGPDGTIYLSRTQNNPSVDYFYAFEDDGFALTLKWSVPAGWSTTSEFGVGQDGSVYMLAPGLELVRLHPDTGEQLDTTGPLSGFSNPRVAIDGEGRVFLGNGAFATGRMYAYTAELDPLWNVAVTNINIGGPILCRNGTLIVCGVGTDVRAYRVTRPGDLNCDGSVDFGDINPFVLAISAPAAYHVVFPDCNLFNADTNEDGEVDFKDINPFVLLLSAGG